MTTTGLQLLGFVLGVFSWAGMIATGASPEWRKNSVGGTALDQHKRYDLYERMINDYRSQVIQLLVLIFHSVIELKFRTNSGTTLSSIVQLC